MGEESARESAFTRLREERLFFQANLADIKRNLIFENVSQRSFPTPRRVPNSLKSGST